MSVDRSTISDVLISGLILVWVTLFAGCMASPKVVSKAGTYEGSPRTIGEGIGRSFVTLDAGGKPITLGIRLSETALLGLPVLEPDNASGWEYILQLPPESASTGYNHIGVDWNPHGHIPLGVYDKPHFDFHFYLIGADARSKITAVGGDLDLAHQAPPPEFMPPGYILPPGTEVPKMGAHAINPEADEFTKKSFTKTFIYGFYGGELIFLEPMMTKAFLETKPNDFVTLATPEKYSRHGYYPTSYSIRFDEDHREYVISLEGLVPR